MRPPGDRPPPGRAWSVLLATGITVLAVASVLWVDALPAGTSARSVRLAADEVILATSDIPDIGWGLRASGTNGSGAWRLFSGHNELVLAFLNVTLWVDSDSAAAARRFENISDRVPYTTQQGQVVGADASLFWSAGSAAYAGMLVRRYNVVFVLSAYLESSWSLTRSDLGTWAGWQLAKIEAAA